QKLHITLYYTLWPLPLLRGERSFSCQHPLDAVVEPVNSCHHQGSFVKLTIAEKPQGGRIYNLPTQEYAPMLQPTVNPEFMCLRESYLVIRDGLRECAVRRLPRVVRIVR